MNAQDKAFIRKMLGKNNRQIQDRNRLFEMGYRYTTDAWCGHDCQISKAGKLVAWRDGRKVTFA